MGRQGDRPSRENRTSAKNAQGSAAHGPKSSPMGAVSELPGKNNLLGDAARDAALSLLPRPHVNSLTRSAVLLWRFGNGQGRRLRRPLGVWPISKPFSAI